MKNPCEKWKDELLDVALSGAAGKDLDEHLKTCRDCAEELKRLESRRARLDALLPIVAQGSEPSTGFRARVLAAAEAAGERKRASDWRGWTLVGTMATAVTALMFVVAWHRGTERRLQEEIAVAQKLVEWRAPSDTLLATPGQEILRTTPKLGESYLKFPARRVEER